MTTPPELLEAAKEAQKALIDFCKSFPTDTDMAEAGWSTAEISSACDSYDNGRAALARLESALQGLSAAAAPGQAPHIRDDEGNPVPVARLVAWLDAKFARHFEIEDKWCADFIRSAAPPAPAAGEGGIQHG